MAELRLSGGALDGFTVPYVSAGRGPAVVLLHGLGGFAESWRRTGRGAGAALHGDCRRPPRFRPFRQASGALQPRLLRQRPRRLPRWAGAGVGLAGRPLAGRRRRRRLLADASHASRAARPDRRGRARLLPSLPAVPVLPASAASRTP